MSNQVQKFTRPPPAKHRNRRTKMFYVNEIAQDRVPAGTLVFITKLIMPSPQGVRLSGYCASEI